MRFQWREPADQARLTDAAPEEILNTLLAARGQTTPAAIAAFLDPTPATLADPFLLADLLPAIERLRLAHQRQELIAIWGDYDVDGLTSTALLSRAFSGMGLQARPYIPHRRREGYGLNADGIGRLAREGCSLIVAVDCGISNREEIATARSLGVDVIVLDHHQIPVQLPEAVATIDPQRADCAYPFKDLAAVGVAYTLVRALVQSGFSLHGTWGEDEADLLDLLELVALGTVADVAPLYGENRTLVAWGLKSLRGTAHPGLRALYQVAGIEPERLSAWEIGHALGPRLNAAGRIADPQPAFRLLCCKAEEEAALLARELDRLNRARQQELARIVEEAIARIEADRLLHDDQPIIQLAGAGWTAGVVGLVAGRLTERYGRPTIVLERGEQQSKGSARSIDGFNLVEALDGCADLLDHYGGHAKAAGLTVANDKLDALRERLHQLATARLSPDDLRPTLTLDLELSLDAMSPATAATLARMEPFGHGNPEPLILLRAVKPRWPRRSADGKHLFFALPQRSGALRCVAFGQGERHGVLRRGNAVDLAGVLRREWWQGEERLAFHVRDFRDANQE